MSDSELGFIKLHRKLKNWQWYHDVVAYKLFTHLLMDVNFKDKKWGNITIKRGQLLTSTANLSRDTGLTIQQVRSALNKLVETKEIYKKATNRFTLLTLRNYELYQGKKEDDTKQTTKQITSKQQANKQANNKQANKQTTTTKEGKEGKEGKNNYSNHHLEIANNLAKHIQSKKRVIITEEKIKSWSKSISLLERIDLKGRGSSLQDMINAINAIENYSHDPFFPVIESGKAFRNKFLKIENYLSRLNKKPKSAKEITAIAFQQARNREEKLDLKHHLRAIN